MPFDFVPLDDALTRPGLRMVVVSRIPSPWTEAAKGILHIKGIDWAAVRLVYDDPRIKALTPRLSGPSVVMDEQRPRDGWADILLLAERLAPKPSLLPADPAERALAMGLAHEICGEEGLGWARRVHLIHGGLNGAGGFSQRVAGYLGRKYGYSPEAGAAALDRVVALLGMLTARLKAQKAAGSHYYIGDRPTAVDVYSATFMALFRPLPEAQCAMDPTTRAAFEARDPITDAALDPILLSHRDHMYAEHLELPLRL